MPRRHREISAENGDIADSGMEFEDVAYSLCELISEMRQYSECSCYPAKGVPYEWLTSKGDISRNNPARNDKYWRKALRVAGFIERGNYE